MHKRELIALGAWQCGDTARCEVRDMNPKEEAPA
jgi:hypothetical protein